jgi:uncharacterized membrane-anchored protein
MKSPVWFDSRRSVYFLIAPALTIGILCASPLCVQAKEQGSKEPNQAKPSAKEKAGKADSEAKEQTVVLGDKLAVVKLPKEFRFVEPESAIAFLKEQGS